MSPTTNEGHLRTSIEGRGFARTRRRNTVMIRGLVVILTALLLLPAPALLSFIGGKANSPSLQAFPEASTPHPSPQSSHGVANAAARRSGMGVAPRSPSATCASTTSLCIADTLVLSNGTLVPGNFSAYSGTYPTGMAYDPTLGEVFATDAGGTDGEDNDSVLVINDTRDVVVAAVDLGWGQESGDLVYDSGNGEVYVSDTFDLQGDQYAGVQVIDAATNTLVAQVGVVPYGAPQVAALAYDSGKEEVFAASYQSVAVISDVTNAIVTSIDLPGVASLTYDPAQGEIFATSGHSASIISDATDSVIATTTVGSSPMAAVYDAGKGQVFVSNFGSSNVSVISGATSKVVATVGGVSAPGLAYDPLLGEVFGGSSGSTVAEISDSTDSVVGTFSTPGELWGGSQEIAYDAGHEELLCADMQADAVCVVNPSTGAAIGQVPIGTSPSGLALDNGVGEIYVANGFDQANGEWGANDTYVISGSTNLVTATVPVENMPVGAAYDSGKGEVFVANAGSGASLSGPYTVSVLRDSTNSVVANVIVGTTPVALAYDSSLGEVFVADSGSGEVSVISDSTDRVTTTIPVGSDPVAIAFDASLSEMFVANEESSSVSVIDDASGSVVATVSVPGGPDAVVYDPVSSEVFASSYSTLSEISDASNTVVASIPIPAGADALALDRRSNDVFVLSGAGSSMLDGEVSQVNATTNVVAGTLGLGEVLDSYGTLPPNGMVFDPANGLLYVSDAVFGAIYLIRGGGLEASAASIPASGAAWLHVNFTASASGGTGTYSTWSWHFGDGTSSSVQDPSHVYAVVGTYTVWVNVTDSSGASAESNILTVSVLPPSPVLESFIADPSSIQVGREIELVITAYGGTGSIQFAYTGLPPGCASSDITPLTCTPSDTGFFTPRAYVNDSAGHSVTATASLTVYPASTGPAISSFSASPATIALGESTTLVVLASGGTPPLSYAYTGLPDGCASSDVASLACDPLGTGTFAVRVFVNDSASESTNAETPLVVEASATPSLSGVVVVPGSESLTVGSSATFTAYAACAGGSCPSGVAFAWSLSAPLGALNTSTGAEVTYAAGPHAGSAELLATASLDGRSVLSAPVNISVTSSVEAPRLLGLPPIQLYELLTGVGLVMLLASTGLFLLAQRRRERDPTSRARSQRREPGSREEPGASSPRAERPGPPPPSSATAERSPCRPPEGEGP